MDNVTNTIWFLLFTSFWILLWRPATFLRAVLAGGLLLLCALSHPLVALFLPIWLLRLVAFRDRRDGVILAAFAVGLAVQLGFSLGAEQAGSPGWESALLPAYPQRVVGGAALGSEINGWLWEGLGPALIVALSAALAAFVITGLRRSSPRARAFVAAAVLASLALFVFTMYQRSLGDNLLWSEGDANPNALPRYAIVPILLLLSAIFVQLDVRPGSLSSTTWNWVRTSAVLFIFVAALASFDASDPALRGTPEWLQQVGTGRAECAQPGPSRVKLLISPPGFEVRTSCRDLGGG